MSEAVAGLIALAVCFTVAAIVYMAGWFTTKQQNKPKLDENGDFEIKFAERIELARRQSGGEDLVIDGVIFPYHIHTSVEREYDIDMDLDVVWVGIYQDPKVSDDTDADE